jgi:hypothetical protein
MFRDLGYGFREAFTGSDDQLQRWVTQFQHDIGEPETGALTAGQWEILSERTNAIKAPHITLPFGDEDNPSITMTKDFVTAEGTLVIEGEQAAYPLNVTSFQCFRDLRYCFQSDVSIDVSGPIYSVLPIQQIIPITSWNDDEVVANDEALCAIVTTTINTRAKEVFQITRNNGHPCQPLHPLDKPRISKLVGGFNFSQDYFAKKQKEADGYYSKEYREYLEAMRALMDSGEKQKESLQAKVP